MISRIISNGDMCKRYKNGALNYHKHVHQYVVNYEILTLSVIIMRAR